MSKLSNTMVTTSCCSIFQVLAETSVLYIGPTNRIMGHSSAITKATMILTLALAYTEGYVTNERLRYALNKHKADIYSLLKKLCNNGFLKAEGHGRGTKYYLPNNHPNLGSNLGSSSKKKRMSREKLREEIVNICSDWVPLDYLATTIGRNPDYLLSDVIPSMLEDGLMKKRTPNTHIAVGNMTQYFNINYEFDWQTIWHRIDEQLQEQGARYVCVADGNILQMVHKDLEYRKIVNASLFSICDSSWVPVFLKKIYGIQYEQYCGSQIFEDLISRKRYRQFFIGTSEEILNGLKTELTKKDSSIAEMSFYSPPFCSVENFDYQGIADMINKDNPDIIWVALGAPKQEIFMYRLQPFLNNGVMIGVGAVFNFYSGLENAPRRAPKWMIDHHLEFVYRLFSEPKKQIQRCHQILVTLHKIYREEKKKKPK